MGYYTRHKLTWEGAPEGFKLTDVIAVLVGEVRTPVPMIEEPLQVGYRLRVTPQSPRRYKIHGFNEDEVATGTREDLLALAGVLQQKLTREPVEEQVQRAYRAWTLILTAQDSDKWYYHEKDMKKVSLVYPEILFTLHRDGEDRVDQVREYYLNGVCEKGQAIITVTYPECTLRPEGQLNG